MSDFGLDNNRYSFNFKAMPYDYLMMQQEAENQGYGIPQPKLTKPEKEENKLPKFYQSRGDEFEPQSFKEAMVEKDATGMLSPFFEHPLGVLGTWLALGYGMDKFAQACGGEYEKSLIGKAGALGDKLHNSKFAQSKPVQETAKFLSNTKAKIGEMFGKKAKPNNYFYAMTKTPEKPEWSMARAMQYNTQEEVVQEFNHIVNVLKLNDPTVSRGMFGKKWEGLIKTNELGLTKDEIENLKKYFNVNKISEIEPCKVSNYTLLKRLGDVPEAEIKRIVETEKTNTKVIEILNKKMGLTPDMLKQMSENPSKYYDKVEEVSKKFRGKVWCGQGEYKLLGPLTKPFKRTIGFDGIANKMHSLKTGAGATHTATGRAFSKMLQGFYRGITFGGGKLGALIFIAPGLVKMVKDTKEAGKGEKVGTAAWGFFESFLWVITFPLSIGALYGIAGLKNTGMSKEQVEEYRNAISKFNERVKKGEFKSFAEYNEAKKLLKNGGKDKSGNIVKGLKDIRKVEGQNLLTKALRKVSGILSFDLNKISAYKNESTLGNIVRKIPNFLKDCGGVPLKFLLCMMAIMPFIDGIFHKASNLLFGKNYDPEKKAEEKSRKKEQAIYTKQDLQNRLVELQNNKGNISQVGAQQAINASLANKTPVNMSGNLQQQFVSNSNVVNPAPAINPINPAPVINTVNTVNTINTTPAQASQNVDNYNYIPAQNPTREVLQSKQNGVDNYTYIPSQNSGVKTAKDTYNENKYIPSQQAISIQKSFDNSGLESALSRADKAEARALNILAGKYENL